MRLMVISSAARSLNFELPLVDDLVGVGIVERDRGVGRKVFEQAQMLLGIGVLLEALNAKDAEDTILRYRAEDRSWKQAAGPAAVFKTRRRCVDSRRYILSIRRQRR